MSSNQKDNSSLWLKNLRKQSMYRRLYEMSMCLSVCRSPETSTQKRDFFSKTKQFRAVVSIDDQTRTWAF